MEILFVQLIVTEIYGGGAGQDPLHGGRPHVGGPGDEPQQNRDDELAQRIGQDDVLQTILRLQVPGSDATHHDRRRLHVAVQVDLQALAGDGRLTGGLVDAVPQAAPAAPTLSLRYGRAGVRKAWDGVVLQQTSDFGHFTLGIPLVADVDPRFYKITATVPRRTYGIM